MPHNLKVSAVKLLLLSFTLTFKFTLIPANNSSKLEDGILPGIIMAIVRDVLLSSKILHFPWEEDNGREFNLNPKSSSLLEEKIVG